MSEQNAITVNQYFEYLNQQKLMGSKCPKCNNIDLPARRLCTKCQNETQWIELKGNGTLATFTVIYVGNRIMIEKGYDRNKPYIYAIAKMEEGPMITGQLLEVDEKNPEQIKIGLQIQVVFDKTELGKDKAGKLQIRTDIAFKPR